MPKIRTYSHTFLVLAVTLLSALMASASDQKLEDLISKHLDSIANAQVRRQIKTRVVQAPAEFRVLSGGSGNNTTGKFVLVSEDHKLRFQINLPTNDYKGEQIVYDGDHVLVASSTARQSRSAFGAFIFVQDAPIREGLLGGVLSTAWPLLDLEHRKAKLSLEGLKNFEGHQAYEVRYRPKKSTDLQIQLYFDPETYHHIATVYEYSIGAQLAHRTPQPGDVGVPTRADTGDANIQEPAESSETLTARQTVTRYRIDEHFSDFATFDGLTLPTHYVLHFTQDLGSGPSRVFQWEMNEATIKNNVGLDPRNFDTK